MEQELEAALDARRPPYRVPGADPPPRPRRHLRPLLVNRPRAAAALLAALAARLRLRPARASCRALPRPPGPAPGWPSGVAATAAALVLAALIVLPAWRPGGSAFAAGLLAVQAGAAIVGSAVLAGRGARAGHARRATARRRAGGQPAAALRPRRTGRRLLPPHGRGAHRGARRPARGRPRARRPLRRRRRPGRARARLRHPRRGGAGVRRRPSCGSCSATTACRSSSAAAALPAARRRDPCRCWPHREAAGASNSGTTAAMADDALRTDLFIGGRVAPRRQRRALRRDRSRAPRRSSPASPTAAPHDARAAAAAAADAQPGLGGHGAPRAGRGAAPIVGAAHRAGRRPGPAHHARERQGPRRGQGRDHLRGGVLPLVQRGGRAPHRRPDDGARGRQPDPRAPPAGRRRLPRHARGTSRPRWPPARSPPPWPPGARSC